MEIYQANLREHQSLAEFFKKPYIVCLPVAFYNSPKLPKMIDWCRSSIEEGFDYAFLGAIEDDNGQWILRIIPDSCPTGLFFAFTDYDEALIFCLTWKGEL
jgi:hypothetical protein